MSAKKKIIIDTDNTVGINGRPMDDALAILYLLGCQDDAEIIGITTNYGNGTAAECYGATKAFLEEIGHTDIPLKKGSEVKAETIRSMTVFDVPDNDEAYLADQAIEHSEAARFIADAVNQHPGEITFLSLGSTTNLYEAAKLDASVYDKLAQIVMMGGITEPLFIHGTPLRELNFSINYEASYDVLTRGHNITIITGNNCLPVSALPKDEFLDNLCANGNPSGMYIAKKCGYRFHDKEVGYGAESSYCWDGVAAAYILRPDVFTDSWTDCYINLEDIKEGKLNPVDASKANCRLNLPVANDRRELQGVFYEGWLSVTIGTHYADYSCTGLYLDKLIQPCILIELYEEESHGFRLLKNLKAKGYVDANLDPTGFYRNLKRMEDDGYLSSRVDENSTRNKRIYRITDFGRRALFTWQDSLRKYTRHINHLIDGIDELDR